MAAVEDMLRLDPADAYGKMDSASKSNYLRAVRAFGADGGAVAAACLELARNGALEKGASAPEAHVGFYLAGGGIGKLRRALGGKSGESNSGDGGSALALSLLSASKGMRVFLHIAAIILLAAAFTAVTASLVRAGGVRDGFFTFSVLLLAAAGFHLAAAAVNFLITRVLPPRTPPGLDFSAGIPQECRSMVAVPVRLTSQDDAGRVLRDIENQYLNNGGTHVHFALLADDAGAPGPDDARPRNLAQLGILRLNKKYGENGGDNFFLFRSTHGGKRGALENLNRYLVGDEPDGFACLEGAAHRLSGVRYVIALRDGTLLPRGAAAKMAGAMAHPLNRPQYDGRRGRVVAGHGMLHPRAVPTLAGSNRTRYARLFPHACSAHSARDAQQDLFGESSFGGERESIHDVAVFQRAVSARFPEGNTPRHSPLTDGILRAGLLGSVTVHRDPPQTYCAAARRRLIRARGDFRAARFLFTARPLGLPGKWKLFDAIRSRFTPAVALALLVSALLTSRSSALYFAVSACVFLAQYAGRIGGGLSGARIHRSGAFDFQDVAREICGAFCRAGRCIGQLLFSLAILPHDACVSAGIAPPARTPLRALWICPATALLVGGAMALRSVTLVRLPYAAPLLLLWLLAPAAADRLSRARRERTETPSERNVRFLRHAARRVWLFFEDFAGEGQNWIPPERFQEHPEGRLVGRAGSDAATGLALLAALSALDLGYATPGDTLRRCGKMLDAPENFAADSGAAAPHLLVLAEGLREIASAPVIPPGLWRGLLDAAQLAHANAEQATPKNLADCRHLEKTVATLCAAPPLSPAACHAALAALEKKATALQPAWNSPPSESRRWLSAFVALCQSALGELGALVPWAAETGANPEWARYAELNEIPVLLDLVNFAPRMAEAHAGDNPLPQHLADLLRQSASRASRRLAALQKILSRCEQLAALPYGNGSVPADRLSVYLGVARNALPQEDWFALDGREFSRSGGSVTGRLAPHLVMPVFEDSFLGARARSAARSQLKYADGLVIAPHAAALAAMFCPEQAARTLRDMADCGFLGAYGFYDAIDFSKKNTPFTVVRSFVTEHQAMTLIALGQALGARPMHRRFLASPILRSAEILLQEPLRAAAAPAAAAVTAGGSLPALA